MTKKILYISAVIAFLLLGACNKIPENTTSRMNNYIGTWVYTYPTSRCIEIFTFNSDGTFSESNQLERQSGDFSSSNKSIFGRRKLTLIIKTANGLEDCTGNKNNVIGTKLSFYVEFSEKSDMKWYALPVFGAPLGTYKKLN